VKYSDYREDKQQGTPDFPIAFYHVEASHSYYQMPYHWHPEYEIIRIIEGSFQFTVDGHLLIAKKNDILFIQSGTLHGGIPDNCIYECIVFDMKLLLGNNKLCNRQIQQLMRHEISIPLKLPEEPSYLKQTIDELFISMSNKKTGYEFIVQGTLYKMLGIIFEARLVYANSFSQPASPGQIKRFKDVINYIENHYFEQISLEDMSRIADLSPRYFCRFFRKMTQSTPTEYLNYYRIECACDQLVRMQCSITEVALNCGFNDISYFIKAFHRAKGVTPKQYREAGRKSSASHALHNATINE
jgi:AraC-like DNA-binding protein